MFLNNRYYDPGIGQFTSVDPLVADTATPYVYSRGNPTTLSDASGLVGVPNRACPDGGCPEKLSQSQVDAIEEFMNSGGGPPFLESAWELKRISDAQERSSLNRARKAERRAHEILAKAIGSGLERLDKTSSFFMDNSPQIACAAPPCEFWRAYSAAMLGSGVPGFDPTMCDDGLCTHIAFISGGLVGDRMPGDSMQLETKERGSLYKVNDAESLPITACGFVPGCKGLSAVLSGASWVIGQTEGPPSQFVGYVVDITAILYRTDPATGNSVPVVLSTTAVYVTTPVGSSGGLSPVLPGEFVVGNQPYVFLLGGSS